MPSAGSVSGVWRCCCSLRIDDERNAPIRPAIRRFVLEHTLELCDLYLTGAFRIERSAEAVRFIGGNGEAERLQAVGEVLLGHETIAVSVPVLKPKGVEEGRRSIWRGALSRRRFRCDFCVRR